MKIEKATRNGVEVVGLEGRLDTSASTDFEIYLQKLVNGGASHVLVDFRQLAFVTSSGLRVLLATAKRLRMNGGNLGVCGLNESVSEVFEISGFSSLLPVFTSVDDALRTFGK